MKKKFIRKELTKMNTKGMQRILSHFPPGRDKKNNLRHIVIAKRVQSETHKIDSGNFLF